MMEVELLLHKNARGFLAAAGRFLYASEPVNSLILGISERLVKYPGAYENPFFAGVTAPSGTLVFAAVMTPPHNMILAGGDDFQQGLPVLISYLKDHDIGIPGVIGPKEIVDGFLKIWFHDSQIAYENKMHQRVYELKAVIMPPMPPGSFTRASNEHIPIIATWLQKFEAETLGKNHPINPERAGRLVNSEVMFVWEKDGGIVSMAMKTRPIKHSTSIGCVYTPKHLRRNGYATALVACLSQHLLDQGYGYVTLFTDLDFPTSNEIYMKIGYQPLCDFLQVSFE